MKTIVIHLPAMYLYYNRVQHMQLLHLLKHLNYTCPDQWAQEVHSTSNIQVGFLLSKTESVSSAASSAVTRSSSNYFCWQPSLNSCVDMNVWAYLVVAVWCQIILWCKKEVVSTQRTDGNYKCIECVDQGLELTVCVVCVNSMMHLL